MRCPKCGYISFDHLAACQKCGESLVRIREKLNLLDFEPNVPYLLEIEPSEIPSARLEEELQREVEEAIAEEEVDVRALDELEQSAEEHKADSSAIGSGEEEGEEVIDLSESPEVILLETESTLQLDHGKLLEKDEKEGLGETGSEKE